MGLKVVYCGKKIKEEIEGVRFVVYSICLSEQSVYEVLWCTRFVYQSNRFMSWSTTYEYLLSNNDRFPQPIPLPYLI
ncbi:hypothetical protein L2E82_48781 [Cichorium intybus]|uniref:Uncharacterized protein n=1 Tax=Cichorium intybus TaxID=13427 RepID=A0ACB8YXY6_CICIN|nr:hypothetical protein L2E82_48781 [Cichorium intybus]